MKKIIFGVLTLLGMIGIFFTYNLRSDYDFEIWVQDNSLWVKWFWCTVVAFIIIGLYIYSPKGIDRNEIWVEGDKIWVRTSSFQEISGWGYTSVPREAEPRVKFQYNPVMEYIRNHRWDDYIEKWLKIKCGRQNTLCLIKFPTKELNHIDLTFRRTDIESNQSDMITLYFKFDSEGNIKINRLVIWDFNIHKFPPVLLTNDR